MLSEKSLAWGRQKSELNELAACAASRRAELGEERVFDFTTGDPVPAPPQVNETLRELLHKGSAELHGYTPASGIPSLRAALAEDLRARFGAPVSAEGIYVCCGAAAGLAACCRGMLCPGEEALVFAPFPTEYRAIVEGAGGTLGVLPCGAGLQPDLDALEAQIGPNTKLLLLSTPNELSGVALPGESLQRLAEILRTAERRFGHTIYLVSEESGRALCDGGPSPSALDFYEDTVLCCSFARSLALPGEGIAFLAVSERTAEKADVFAALAGAARAAGYVNAPSLMQRCVERCLGLTADISALRESCALLEGGLRELGFECVHPDLPCFLFVKSPEPDARAFSARARQFELFLVPGDEFGLEGYVRLACPVSAEQIRRALPAFRALAESYGL